MTDFKSLLLQLSTEMSYFKEPLPQIFQRIAEMDNREINILLRECLSGYHQELFNITDIWKEAVDHVYEDTALTKDDLHILKKCGDFLGQSDFNHQKSHFDLLNMEVDRQLNDANEAIKTKGKMYSKMGVSIGLVIAIVLI